jgi:putative redox protein
VESNQNLRAEIGNDNYLVTIHSGNNDWYSDEPIDAGGKDRGPDPYELLLSSLASCTLITIRMYAERKGWNLDRAEVAVSFTWEEIEKIKHTNISRKIYLYGNLSEEQKERLLYIAKACPISKVLEGKIVLECFLDK